MRGNPMRKCIVNYVTNDFWFPKGQQRLIESLQEMKFDGDNIMLDERKFTECPKHSDVPYAFKVFAIQEAKDRGYDLILWMDASFWAIRPLNNVFKIIEDDGYIMQDADEWLGHWCSDIVLERFGIGREEAFNIPMYSAGLTGLNMKNEKAVNYLEQWVRYAKEGICFKGNHRNIKHCVSKDDRVQGHRHDMSVGAILAHQLKMTFQPCHSFFSVVGWYKKPESYLHLEDSVCFCARGGVR